MTFTSAVQSIREGEAIKRESWNGYAYKIFADGSTYEEPKFDLVFKAQDGTETVYPFGTDTKEVPMMLSKKLIEGFMRDDWIRGTIESFERARVGGDF